MDDSNDAGIDGIGLTVEACRECDLITCTGRVAGIPECELESGLDDACCELESGLADECGEKGGRCEELERRF